MNFFFRSLLIVFFGATSDRLGASAGPTGAQVVVNVEVPGYCQTPPFDREGALKIPKNAKISVLARVEKARFLALSPQGDILVSQPSSGKILLVRQSSPT